MRDRKKQTDVAFIMVHFESRKYDNMAHVKTDYFEGSDHPNCKKHICSLLLSISNVHSFGFIHTDFG